MGNQTAKEEPKINLSPNSVIVSSPVVNTPPTLLAWCSNDNNKISVINLKTKQNYVTFDGVMITKTHYSRTHIKEIPNTKLLVSLHHKPEKLANMEIFDISKKGKANKIYSLGVSGMVGDGDVAYNSRRSILGAIPVAGRIAYHLFTVNTSASNAASIVKLNRKSKWHSQHTPQNSNYITGFDFSPAGDSIAILDRYGVCLISNVNTNDYGFHLQVKSRPDVTGRCRWSTNTGEPLLFVKYNWSVLNILDVEKKALILSDPVQLDLESYSIWIDVCQSNANLMTSGGSDKAIRIFDKRKPKIVKTLEGIHSDNITCVRWNPRGDMIASASLDGTAKLLDFKKGKVLYTGTTSGYVYSACFI